MDPGTDVMIFEIFLPKNGEKNAQITSIYVAKRIITLIFKKNANFLPKMGENRRKQ
jgi:hypothetical protein